MSKLVNSSTGSARSSKSSNDSVIAHQSSCGPVLDAHAQPFEAQLSRGYISATIANDCACVHVQYLFN